MLLNNRLVLATFQLLAGNTAPRLLTILVVPVLTHFITPETFGLVVIFNTVISFCSIFALGGLDATYARTYHSNTNPSGKNVEILLWRYAVLSSLVVALLIVVTWWFYLSTKLHMPAYFAFYLGIGIFLLPLNIMALTYARLNDKFLLISISLSLSAIVNATISIGGSIFVRQDELPLLIALITSYMIPILIIRIPISNIIKPCNFLNFSQKISIFKIGISGVITSLAYWILTSIDKLVLSQFEKIEMVGIYSISYGVATTGALLNVAIASAWLPEASRLFEISYEKAQQELSIFAEKFILVLGLVWFLVTSTGGDIVRLLTSTQFHQGTSIIPLIAAGVFFQGVSHISSASLLLMHKQHLSIRWWIFSVIISILLNILLIPFIGMIGAAFSYMFSFALLSLGIYHQSQKEFFLTIRTLRLFTVISLIAIVGSFLSPAWSISSINSLLFKLPFMMIVVLLSLAYMDLLRNGSGNLNKK